jgi:hypothetical protein
MLISIGRHPENARVSAAKGGGSLFFPDINSDNSRKIQKAKPTGPHRGPG